MASDLVTSLKSKTTGSVIQELKKIFARFGIPKFLVADHVPFSCYEFVKFSEEWGFQVINSSPHYPKSNGFAERAVGIFKNLVKKSGLDQLELALLNYNSTPVVSMGLSPSQLLQGRVLKSKLPVDDNLLKPLAQPNLEQQIEIVKNKSKQIYDKGSKLREVKFVPCEEVLVQDKFSKIWEKATIVKKLEMLPRCYLVKNSKGNIVRRNQIFIKKYHQCNRWEYSNKISFNLSNWMSDAPHFDDFENFEEGNRDDVINLNQERVPSFVSLSNEPDNNCRTRSGRMIKKIQKLNL